MRVVERGVYPAPFTGLLARRRGGAQLVHLGLAEPFSGALCEVEIAGNGVVTLMPGLFDVCNRCAAKARVLSRGS